MEFGLKTFRLFVMKKRRIGNLENSLARWRKGKQLMLKVLKGPSV